MAVIHHLNCGSMCPLAVAEPGEGLFGNFVCHCLLIETDDGLILVDTGVGLEDTRRGLGLAMELSCRPRRDPAECACSQVEALGFTRADVRHIITTHLDLDHAGGLPDFPHATVHVHAAERDASQRRDLNGKTRYLPRQLAHDVKWQLYSEAGDSWMGLEAVRVLEGVGEEVVLVPLPGHSQGHCGVAVRGEDDRWLFHCGDAFFHRNQVIEGAPVPFMIKVFQETMAFDRKARDHNIRRLTTLAAERPDEVRLFCAHDATSFAALRGG